MKKLILANNVLKVQNDHLTTVMGKSYYDTQIVHVNHTHDNIEDLKEDSYDTFLVYENCSNFAKTHLVSEDSEDSALEFVYDYLIESESLDCEEEIQLIGVEKLTF